MGGRDNKALLAAVAGPSLIVLTVAVVLHAVVFAGRMSHQTPDWQSYWLPTYCTLGRALSAGSGPGWNPHAMAGTRLAGDPQSGWMYLTPMILFSLLRCDVAMRLFFVLQPILGGLGLYAFLRAEGLGRAAATSGGLALALAVAGSDVLTSVPFAGALAWSALLLAATSRYLAARSWPARLGWLIAVALTWGQLAAAHLSNGLVMGTGAMIAYGLPKVIAGLRERTRDLRETAMLALLLMIALPAVNLAFLLPRLAYLPSSTLGKGYVGLDRLAAHIQGSHPLAATQSIRAVQPVWGLRFAVSPGAYLGAVPLLLAFAGLWTKRLRLLTLGFIAYAVVNYLLGLMPVASTLRPLVGHLPFGDFYLHGPGRFEYSLLLILPVLGAIGIESWSHAETTVRRIAMVVPGFLLWVALPLAAGFRPGHLLMIVLGAIAGAAALVAFTRRPVLLALVPCLLALELSVSDLIGQAATLDQARTGLEHEGQFWPLRPLQAPDISLDSYVRGGRIEHRVAGGRGRLLTLVGPSPGGPRPTQRYRPTLSSTDVVEGYNPIQELLYWEFVRAVSPVKLTYKSSVFSRPTRSLIGLLQVHWIASRIGRPRHTRARRLTRERGFKLYAVRHPSPRASFVGSWMKTTSARALRLVSKPRFDPSRTVILNRDPGLSQLSTVRRGPGTATYQAVGTEAARVVVQTDRPGIVLIRNAYDRNWHATVDGRPAPVRRADYFLQAVAMPPGHHVLWLRYDDPSVLIGIIGSLASIAALGVGVGALKWRERPELPHPGGRPPPCKG